MQLLRQLYLRLDAVPVAQLLEVKRNEVISRDGNGSGNGAAGVPAPQVPAAAAGVAAPTPPPPPDSSPLPYVPGVPDVPTLLTAAPSASGFWGARGARGLIPHVYAALERRCDLPAASPLGMPACTQLRGEPLRNVAPLYSTARMSSSYPHEENRGAAIARDGVLNLSYFHTQCDGAAQWWRLDFTEPVGLWQIALHNRPDHRYRLVGATIVARAVGGGAPLANATVATSRAAYVWTLSPPLARVGSLEVRLPEKPAGEGCLHFLELEAFGALYPAAELSARNAQSRTDGYWPFVGRKEKPPIGLTYGEFPLPFFTALTDRACDLAGLGDERSGATFCDIGSGAGRLVLWAAATHAWRAALGVELLPGLCRAADAKLEAARALAGLQLRTPRVELSEGSWDDASVVAWGEIDVAFAYTTAFPADEANVLQELTAALAPRPRVRCG